MSSAISELLNPQCVVINGTFKSSEEVIRSIGQELFKLGFVKDSFVQAAIDREKVLPTGLPLAGGFNAAIPHTEIEHVIKPALGMAILKKPIIFQNMISPSESVPVSLVFLLALDQPKAQIEMLQEVASVLQNPKLVTELIGQDNVEGVLSCFED
jgi:PTS system galactitol-specific IIA component